MALPSSGTITMDMIRNELQVYSQSPFGLNEARSGTYATINPCSTYKPPSTGQISLSDWYGYNHTQTCPGVLTCYTLSINTTYPDGCNGFSDEVQVWTITLKDQYGNPYTASSTLTVTVQYDWNDVQDYGGGSGTSTQDILIYAGNSSGATTFYPMTHQYCNYSSVCDGSCYDQQYNFTIISTPSGIGSC
jgi:hypothetical protein